MLAESFFLLFILIAFTCLIGGLMFRSASVILLAGVLFMIMGLFLMSGQAVEHNQIEQIKITDMNSHTLHENIYKSSDISDNFTLDILHYIFFYGSFALYAIALVTFMSRRRDTFVE
jgi:ammonia channel protein AmtB